MKQIDTGSYISALRQLVQEGHEVSVPIAGNSMMPFLIDRRDAAWLRAPQRPLKVGDIVFYQRSNGAFILHRICRLTPDGFYAVGDAQQLIEGPLARSQVFAVVTAVRRKGKRIGPGHFWWEFFRLIWIRMIPLRHRILKLYGIPFAPTGGKSNE